MHVKLRQILNNEIFRDQYHREVRFTNGFFFEVDGTLIPEFPVLATTDNPILEGIWLDEETGTPYKIRHRKTKKDLIMIAPFDRDE